MRAAAVLPCVAGSETSRLAAESMRDRAPTALARVWVLLLMHPGGLTDEEGCAKLHMNPSTYRPRRVELSRGLWDGEVMVRPALLEKCGRRPTASGRLADVWRCIPGLEVEP